MASFWNSLMDLAPRVYRTSAAGVDTRVVEAGPLGPAPDHEPVLLVHGASGHLESFVRTMPFLAHRRRVIAFDLPWHGYASHPDHPYTVAEYADFVVELARRLSVDGPVHLVGQSLGAAIAGRIAIERTLPVGRLVLIGAAGVPGTRRNASHSMRAALRDRSYASVKSRLEYAMAYRGPEMDELIECRYVAYQRGDWPPRAEAFSFHEEGAGRRSLEATEEEWRSLALPTLLVWGSEDRVVPPSAGRRLAELVAGSRLDVFDGCGHNPQFERPYAVNPVVDAFLAGDTEPPGGATLETSAAR
ncbi:MAG TPA: alpha/beta fold hydrolase [Acidimicrobiales bacterium]|nr:alpha/beta fold hydrolase [Acidimicrobiales bacterium]